ncbi:hypothetical protein SSX86_015454 [Deinandra increscens subsp. villosa]|uniref:HMG box domain-containing protein n=1 Tax=Deinandra increscens subsp. villosa TaxID=3103831 RepID=A0AAP0D4D5_9ASTR
MKGAKGKGPATRNSLKPVDDRKVGKKKAPAKDPNKPKRPAAAFFVFLEEFRVTFKKQNPYVKFVSACGKAGGKKWRSMSAAERAADDVEEDSDESIFEEEDSDKSTSEVDEESGQAMESTSKPSSLPMDNIAQKPRLAEHQSDSHGVNRSSKVNAFEQQKDQPFLMPLIQSSISNYGNAGGNYSSPHMNMPSQSFKPPTHDFISSSGLQRKDQSLMSSTTYVKQAPLDQMNDAQHNYQMSTPQEGTIEMMSSRPGFSTSTSVTAQLERQNVPAGSSSLAVRGNTKSSQKTPTVSQKKQSEALVSSLRKQKVSGALSDQSIEQLNDVTAVSGVNLREEEEQLFSGSKEDSQLSEAFRKAVQEEERPILQKTHMINCGGRSSDVERCLSQLLDNDGDVEHLDSNQECRELVENVSSMSDSVEKFASPHSDIICIQGYKVKRSNATILEGIFKKHGDIAANCILKTLSARAYHLEVICEVVRQIQTQDLIEMGEDIECQLSDAEAVNINVSWIRAHFEAIHKSKKTSENLSLLMAMKENMILIIQAAEMDRAKRSLELSAADKCVRVLHLFQQNLNDNILKK